MSWLGAIDVAVRQHLHIKHMFRCYLKKRQQNIIRRATGCLEGDAQGGKRDSHRENPEDLSGVERWRTSSAQCRDCMDGYWEEPGRKILIGLQPINGLPFHTCFIDLILSSESRNELMNCNCTWRKREETCAQGSRTNDCPPWEGGHM